MLSKLISNIWPIRRDEREKFAIMALLMFLVLVNQNIVRNIKDCLIVKLIGAESLGFIKLLIEVPFSIILVFLYTKLCNVLNQHQVFRFVLVFFLLYFLAFLIFLFPNRELLHPDAFYIDHLVKLHPHWKWFIRIWGNWVIVSFYVVSELWPIIMFSLLFWQLANNTTCSEQASRFYPCLSIVGQSNLLFSSKIVSYAAGALSGDRVEVSLGILLLLVVVSGICVLIVHRYLEMKIRQYPAKYFVPPEDTSPLAKVGLRASIKMVLSSRYLICICCMVVCYSLSINLIEGLWLFKAGQFCTTATQMMLYNARVTFFIGVVALVFSMTGGYVIRRFGWLTAALLTPGSMLITGSLFFLSVILCSVVASFGFHPLAIMVFLGGMHSAIGKGIKYSVFDTTKEMAYIPLDNDLKTKGKAAVEVLGPKVGKAVGGVQAAVFFLFPSATYDTIAPFLMILFACVLTVWAASAASIYRNYAALVKKEQISLGSSR
jgi:ATP:ADP antiporter, AAA family